MSDKPLIEIVGPGIWFNLHINSLKCENKVKKKKIIDDIEDMRKTFFCTKCRNHINLFCKKYPIFNCPIVYDQDGNDISLFRWTWLLHNHVNIRLGKPIMTLDEALDFYSNVLSNDDTCNTCSM